MCSRRQATLSASGLERHWIQPRLLPWLDIFPASLSFFLLWALRVPKARPPRCTAHTRMVFAAGWAPPLSGKPSTATSSRMKTTQEDDAENLGVGTRGQGQTAPTASLRPDECMRAVTRWDEGLFPVLSFISRGGLVWQSSTSTPWIDVIWFARRWPGTSRQSPPFRRLKPTTPVRLLALPAITRRTGVSGRPSVCTIRSNATAG